MSEIRKALEAAATALDRVGEIEGEIDGQTYDQYRRMQFDPPDDAVLDLGWSVKRDRELTAIFLTADKALTNARAALSAPSGYAEAKWARMIEAHRQSALSWEKSARELDAALVAATGCEPRYDHDHDEGEIAF